MRMKRKLILYMLVPFVFAIILLTFIFQIIANDEYESNVKKNLLINNGLIINTVNSGNVSDVRKLIEGGYKNSEIRTTYVEKSGVILYDSQNDSETMDNHKNRQEIVDARKKGVGFSKRYSKTEKKYMIYCASILNSGDFVRSSMACSTINAFEAGYIKYYAAIFLCTIIISVIISARISEIVIKPVKKLQYATSSIEKGDLNKRVSIYTNDEIGELACTFNKMADKLQYTINDSIDKKNRLETIMKSMDSGVIAVDNNFKIIMINPYAEKIFGIKENAINRKLINVIKNYDLEEAFKDMESEYKEIDVVYPVKRSLRVRTAKIANGEKTIGIVAVIQDVTNIKKLENIRSEFVANVTHELKTPLTSIKGFAETLKFVDDNETKNRFLDIINDESERLTRLINDILLLSDMESSKSLKKEDVDVNHIIKDVCDMMRASADKKNIKIEITGNTVPSFSGDCDRFKQMILNLVDNAVKYSGNGKIVRINKEVDNEKLTISVADNGIGIPTKHLGRLFERFYRVDKARSRSQGGTGLGLAIVKHIVLGFGGKIDVQSEVGKGTEFTVTIPYI